MLTLANLTPRITINCGNPNYRHEGKSATVQFNADGTPIRFKGASTGAIRVMLDNGKMAWVHLSAMEPEGIPLSAEELAWEERHDEEEG